jgi:hypothetical protein
VFFNPNTLNFLTTNLVVVLNAHAERVDENGEQDALLEVFVLNQGFDQVPNFAQATHAATPLGWRPQRLLVAARLLVGEPLGLALGAAFSALIHLAVPFHLRNKIHVHVLKQLLTNSSA